ncbi:MAG: hypothetical protein EBT19_00575 [Methylocystaceae bacterium]|nr:hypothetical protein [Methylocystaceae bacterium]NBV93899.1 hypothetical protein [Methylocystaceae bacterium]
MIVKAPLRRQSSLGLSARFQSPYQEILARLARTANNISARMLSRERQELFGFNARLSTKSYVL